MNLQEFGTAVAASVRALLAPVEAKVAAIATDVAAIATAQESAAARIEPQITSIAEARRIADEALAASFAARDAHAALPALLADAQTAGEAANAAIVARLDAVRDDIAAAIATALSGASEAHSAAIAGMAAAAAEAAGRHAAEIEKMRADFAEELAAAQAAFESLRGRVLAATDEARRIAEAAALRPMLKGDAGRDGVFRAPVGWERRDGGFVQGTMARHRGGLWWSYRDTDSEPGSDGDSGWVIVVDGTEKIEIIQGDEPYQFTLAIAQSSGARITHAVEMPMIDFRGIWLTDEGYAKNALAVRSGSLWIAKRANRGVVPGAPEAVDDWQMVAKRGKDGIDAAAERGWNWRGSYVFGDEYENNEVVRAGMTLWLARRRTKKPPKAGDDWEVLLSADAVVTA